MHNNKQTKFDLSYLEMAQVWAKNSYCKRKQVGALIVKDRMIISDGYNGTPSGFENVCEDETGATKTMFSTLKQYHNQGGKSGNSSEGSTLCDCLPVWNVPNLSYRPVSKGSLSEDYRITDGIDLLRRAGIEVQQL